LKKLTNSENDSPNLTPIDAELDQQEVTTDEDLGPWSPDFSLNSRREERQLALSILYAFDRFESSVPAEDVVHNFEKSFDLKIPKKSFTYALVRGVTEHTEPLDEQLKPYLKNWRLERLGCCTHLILRLALWELTQPDPIPSIIINEAVELAKTYAEKDAYRFVNGILDEIAKSLFENKTEADSSSPNESNHEK